MNNSIKIYPNPFQNNITVDNFSNENIIQIKIYNNLGKVVQKSTENIFATNKLASGVYFIKLEFDSGKSIFRKMIRR